MDKKYLKLFSRMSDLPFFLAHCIADIVYFLDQHEVAVNSMHVRTSKAHLLPSQCRDDLCTVFWPHLFVLGVIETNHHVLADVIRRACATPAGCTRL